MTLGFALNLILAFSYVLLTGEPSFFNAGMGFVIGFVILYFLGLPFGATSYSSKLWRLTKFACYFLKILIESNFVVAKQVLTPGLDISPRIIKYSVEGMTPIQITVLANTITLTPGTLSADICDEGHYLYIHAMFAEDRDAAVADLDELKKRVLEEVFA